MILIADSGSTRTQWVLIDGEKQLGCWETIGLNPFYYDKDAAGLDLESHLIPQLKNRPAQLFFYGSGCKAPENSQEILGFLQGFFPETEIHVDHDLRAAARSLCQTGSGLVCILGTGSSSCLYDGEKIVDTKSSLGYVLGDEGSGAVLGMELIRDYLYQRLPLDLREAFMKENPVDPFELLKRVYTQPFPNRFLAEFTPFLHEHREHPHIIELTQTHFTKFLERNALGYDRMELPVHFMGSVAFYFQEEIEQCCQEMGLHPGKFEKDPLSGLVHYHSGISR